MGQTIRKGLYTQIDIEPMTYQGIQNDILIDTLKNPDPLKWRPVHTTLPDLYASMLYKEPQLYDKRYLDWSFTMDYPAGQIYVQSRVNQPREPLHRVTFEKDYE